MFLGPGGAQANLPQVYWKDIGGTVDAVSGAHARPQPHLRRRRSPRSARPTATSRREDIARFRSLWAAYGSAGLSWWSWQATTEPGWAALAQPLAAPPAPAARPGLADARQGQQGRPGRVAAAAPRVLRPDGDGHEHVRRRHRPGAAQLPDLARPAGHRAPPTRSTWQAVLGLPRAARRLDHAAANRSRRCCCGRRR